MASNRRLGSEDSSHSVASSSAPAATRTRRSATSRHSIAASSPRSPSKTLYGDQVNGQGDDDEDDDGSDSSDQPPTADEDEEEEEDDKDDDGSLSLTPVKQAHLTPHRPSRHRKLPARYEADEPSTVIPLDRIRPSLNQRVTVEVRQGTVKARTKSTFTEIAPAKSVEGAAKWAATIVTSDSGSGEGDEETATQIVEQAASGGRRRAAKQSSPDFSTPSRRNKRSAGAANGHDVGPASTSSPRSIKTATPSRAATSVSKSAKSAGDAKSSPANTKSHPKPIKRPKLSEAPSPATPKRKKASASLGAISPSTAAAFEPTKPFLQPTSADYYFAAHAARRRSATSKSDSWSAANGRVDRRAELPALTSKEVAQLSSSAPDDPLSHATIGALALNHYRGQYPSWTSLLFMGNDLMFYGLGAKEIILEDFAASKAEEGEAAVVIIRGRMGIRSEEWVESIEEALELGNPPASKSGLDARLRRIAASLEGDVEEHSCVAPRLILVLHSLDSPSFLAPRTRSHLASLASFSHRVHLMCSLTHPNGTLLSRYTGREALWIDCTTLLPMLDDCLLSASGTRLGGLPRPFDLRAGGGVGGLTGMGSRRGQEHAGSARAVGGEGHTMTSAAEQAAGGGGGGAQNLLSATAALHVLKSVTIKARALFLRLASELNSPTADAGGGGGATPAPHPSSSTSTSTSTASLPLASRSIAYTRLSTLASRNFIATTEMALRALLVEFTSHGLVRLARAEEPGTAGAAEERVYIRMATLAELDEVVKGVKTLA